MNPVEIDELFTGEEQDHISNIFHVCFDGDYNYDKDVGLKYPKDYAFGKLDVAEVDFLESLKQICYVKDDMIFFKDEIYLRMEILIL